MGRSGLEGASAAECHLREGRAMASKGLLAAGGIFCLTAAGLIIVFAGGDGSHTGQSAGETDERIKRVSGSSVLGPRMIFDRLSHDFGTRVEGDELTFRFEFANSGSEDLVIQRTRFTCACVGASESVKTVQPGDSGHIDVRLSSDPGGKKANVYIEANDPAGIHILTVRGEIIPRISVQPQYIDFGEVRLGGRVEREFAVNVTQYEEPPYETFDGFRFDVSTDALEILPAAAERSASKQNANSLQVSHVRLALNVGATKGRFKERVVVKYPYGQKMLKRYIAVRWTAVASLETSPESGFFAMFEPGEAVQDRVEIIARRGEQFEILGVSCDSDAIALDVTPVALHSHYALIARPKRGILLNNSIRGTVVVMTTDEHQARICIPVRFLRRPIYSESDEP